MRDDAARSSPIPHPPSLMSVWHCGSFALPLGRRTLIMGIVNVTPDSFSGDGVHHDVEAAVRQALQLVEDGADILDIGGESTRPGSDPVDAEEEMARVLPLIERLAGRVAVPLSVDTSKAVVARAALQAGASVINDITGLRGDPAMVKVAAAGDAGLVLMHIKGEPKTMMLNPTYDNLLGEVIGSLRDSLRRATDHGISRQRVAVDPGIGFGKTAEHSLEILRRLGELRALGFPLLVGTSRKSFIGKVLNLPVEQRAWGTAATVALAIANGADIVRVHDVKEMVQVARMTDAIVRP